MSFHCKSSSDEKTHSSVEMLFLCPTWKVCWGIYYSTLIHPIFHNGRLIYICMLSVRSHHDKKNELAKKEHRWVFYNALSIVFAIIDCVKISSGIMVKSIGFGPMGYRQCLITMTSEIGNLFCLKLHMTEIMLRKHSDVSMKHQKFWIKKTSC